jgi:hypothetical protein
MRNGSFKPVNQGPTWGLMIDEKNKRVENHVTKILFQDTPKNDCIPPENNSLWSG